MRLLTLLFWSVTALAQGPNIDVPKGPAPALGMTLPHVRLHDVRQHPFDLRKVEAPVLVINLWAFWCDTWKQQLPQLRELSRQQEQLGFRLVAVSIDGAWTDVFWEHCGEKGLPFPVLIDSRRELATRLSVRCVPTVLVVDRARRIRYVHEAYPGNPAVLRSIRQVASESAE